VDYLIPAEDMSAFDELIQLLVEGQIPPETAP
jgi:hypothetical protein